MKVFKFMVSPLLHVMGAFRKQKKEQAAPVQPGPVMRDDAQNEADKRNDLMRRRGGAADIVTGYGGAEPGAGSKTVLGQ